MGIEVMYDHGGGDIDDPVTRNKQVGTAHVNPEPHEGGGVLGPVPHAVRAT
jgi:hypothetical protein